MSDMLRDSMFGTVVNWASGGRILPFRDQKPDYVVPARYYDTTSPALSDAEPEKGSSCSSTIDPIEQRGDAGLALSVDEEKSVGATVMSPPAEPNDPYLVGWDSPDDPDNPK